MGPFERFGKFVLSTFLAVLFLFTLTGWWQIVTFIMIFVAIEDGYSWLREIDRRRYK